MRAVEWTMFIFGLVFLLATIYILFVKIQTYKPKDEE